MLRTRLVSSAFVAGLLAVAVACSNTPGSPTSPTSMPRGEASAIGDLSLKSNAPTLLSPDHDFAYDNGSTVTLEFQAARGTYVDTALQHQIEIRNNADGQVVYSAEVGGSGAVAHELPTVPPGAYEWRVRAFTGDAAGPWSSARTFSMKAPTRGPISTGARTPNPPPGVRLPAPDRFNVVIAVANQYPHFLFNSCQEHHGTWDFMDTVVDTLRAEDTRWGYAWKRGVVGDPLLDIVAYNWSGDPDEGTRNIYTIDIIGGHCGSFPVPVWNNTQPGGGPGLSSWTGRGRF